MSRCVSERGLVEAYYGEGDASRQAHLRTCLRCAGRLQRLTRDLQAIEQTLRGAPPVSAVGRRATAQGRRAAVAAGLAALVLLAGVEAWMWRESISWVRPQPDADAADALPFLEQVSAVLSPTGDTGGALGAPLALASEAADEPGGEAAEWTDALEED